MGSVVQVWCYPGPFLFHESLLRFRVSKEELVNSYADGVYRRIVEDPSGDLVLLEAEIDSGGRKAIRLRITKDGRMTKSSENAGFKRD